MRSRVSTIVVDRAGGFARALGQLRQRAGLSLSELSRRAGIGKATLSRWEGGRAEPTIGALNALLDALHVEPERREALYALIRAPRGLREVRRVERELQPELADAGLSTMPAGRLIRALRMRQGLRISQVATRIGIAESTLSRWETGERLADHHSILRLCDALQASEGERQAILSQRILGTHRVTLDGLIQEFTAVIHRLQSLQVEDIELRLIALEADAWVAGKRDPRCLELLGSILDLHSFHLAELGRWTEADRVCRKSLSLPESGLRFEFLALPPYAQLSWLEHSRSGGRRTAHIVETMLDEARYAPSDTLRSEILFQSLPFLAMSGLSELIESYADEACRAGGSRLDVEAVRSWFLGEAYLREHAPDRAMRVLPEIDGPYTRPLHIATAWAEAHILADDLDAAKPFIDQMRELMAIGPFANFDEQRVLALYEASTGEAEAPRIVIDGASRGTPTRSPRTSPSRNRGDGSRIGPGRR